MFYNPKFCCHCGEKIERAVTSVTDSGRFCDICKHDFIVPRALPKVFAALMAVFGIFGIGSYWRSGDQPLNVTTGQFAANRSKADKDPANQSNREISNPNAPPPNGNVQSNAAQKPNLTAKPLTKPAASTPVSALEAVYFCGAETKKGAPCSRRVKGGGRCWQHRGQTAMLADEKLLVNQ